jgi:hypothetical protein
MRSKIFSILTVLILLRSTALYAGIAVENSTDKDKITIGERIPLSVKFTYTDGIEIKVPDEYPQLKAWELKNITKEASKDEKNNTLNIRLELATFTTGQAQIPELVFEYSDNKNKFGRIKTRPINVTVESMIAKYGDSGDIRDIKPPVRPAYSVISTFKWLLVVFLAALFLYLLYKKYLKHRLPEIPARETPKIPPAELALNELEKLKNSGLIKEGRIKEFYIAMTDIVRDYLSADLDIQTRDRTTTEIYQDLRKGLSDRKYLNAIKNFFDECDLVKFARYRPDEKICFEDFEMARNIVEKTS